MFIVVDILLRDEEQEIRDSVSKLITRLFPGQCSVLAWKARQILVQLAQEEFKDEPAYQEYWRGMLVDLEQRDTNVVLFEKEAWNPFDEHFINADLAKEALGISI